MSLKYRSLGQRMPTAVYVPSGMNHIEPLRKQLKAPKQRANGRKNSQHCWPNNTGMLHPIARG